ncbi:T9SS type A sorting domain-containing protein [Hymenobacter sp. BT730]|uniref:T9SS type A sorting domain-containing protein n=1 Tax=Hymenobacter sp. BT730 TaxID=3063332 RepID=UPI0026DF99EB|nr:T9SS type A sorting domain-containing protein [Hymenobacter sp. BT730]
MLTFRWILTTGSLCWLVLTTALAQQPGALGFEYQPVAKVVHGNDTLRLAWAGGLNSPQFSNIDFDHDGQNDLFIYDRISSRIFTYRSIVGRKGQRQWQYAPEFEALFPADITSWALLRDYDCDNRPDLFAHGTGGDIRVYHNELNASGTLSFRLVSNQLRYFNTSINNGNIFANPTDLPALDDLDGDGKLDLLMLDFATSNYVTWYRNVSPTCGGLDFKLETSFWGEIRACAVSCAGFAFGPGATCPLARPQHTSGFTLLTLDLDNDGDRDLLSGRDECHELASLTNAGSATTARMTAAGLSTHFPASTPAHELIFPAAYSADVTFDGRPDLLVAPALFGNEHRESLRQSVWLYENTAASGAPVFTFRQPDFLQQQMLEVSEAAAPALTDIDADGLPDLLIGNGGDEVDGSYRAALAYYHNDGTATNPVFRLVTMDYLNLSSQKLTELKPVFADLNQDGAIDLAFAATTAADITNLYYILNTAAAGNPLAFNTQNMQTAGGLTSLPGLAPALVDVDADGYVDVLVGTNAAGSSGGSLRYYRQQPGTTGTLQFTLQNEDFGQIRTAASTRPINLAPVVVDADGDTQPDLLTVDNTGVVQFFSNFRSLSGAFSPKTDLFYQPLSKQYAASRFGTASQLRLALAAADVNGDAVPELLVGQESGGVQSFRIRQRPSTGTATRPAREPQWLQVFPNPSAGAVHIQVPGPGQVTVLDVTGRTVRAVRSTGGQPLQVTGLAAGVYVVRVTLPDGRVGVRRLVVR